MSFLLVFCIIQAFQTGELASQEVSGRPPRTSESSPVDSVQVAAVSEGRGGIIRQGFSKCGRSILWLGRGMFGTKKRAIITGSLVVGFVLGTFPIYSTDEGVLSPAVRAYEWIGDVGAGSNASNRTQTSEFDRIDPSQILQEEIPQGIIFGPEGQPKAMRGAGTEEFQP